jgi:hypothetical protein
MIGSLRFKLPEEEIEFTTALNGGKYLAVLSELDNWLRSQYKYAGSELHGEVRSKLYEILEEYDVNIHE